MKYRRISLYGGPGSGKSTTASGIYSAIKRQNKSVELVREVVKEWVYQGRTVRSFDQIHLLGAQMHAEDLALRNVDLIVTDSPLPLQVAYAKRDNPRFVRPMLDLCHLFEAEYPSIHVFLDRKGIEYDPNGRFEDFEAAKRMDVVIKDVLEAEFAMVTVPAMNPEAILDLLDD